MGDKLIVATRNPEKLVELRRILEAGRVPVDVGDLGEYPDMPEVAETGLTFTENALLKARAVAAFTGLPAVADDSGLCVDALNGMPGVLSARWSGRHGDEDANLQLVLGQLADIPAEHRGAQFACAAALVLPSGTEHVTEGLLGGTLATAPTMWPACWPRRPHPSPRAIARFCTKTSPSGSDSPRPRQEGRSGLIRRASATSEPVARSGSPTPSRAWPLVM